MLVLYGLTCRFLWQQHWLEGDDRVASLKMELEDE